MKVLAVFLSLASVALAFDNWSIIYEVSDRLYGTQEVDANLKPILTDILDHLMQVTFSAPETEQAYLQVYPTLESFPEHFVPTLNAALEDRHTSPILIKVFTDMLDHLMNMIMAIDVPEAQPVNPIVTPVLPVAPSPIDMPVAPIVEPIVEQPIAAAKSPLVQLILNIKQN